MAYTRKLPSGRWQAGYRDQQGKQRSAGTHPTKKAAMLAAVTAENQKPTSTTLWGAWEATWTPTRTVEASTLAADESRLTKYVRPRWTDVPLNAITRADIQTWINELDGSPSTIRKVGAVLSASLRDAVRHDLLDHNPALNVVYPKPEQSPQRWLTRAQTDAIREAIPEGDHRDFYDLLIGTGMRFGEGAGLHWDQINLERATITVRWSADRGRGFKAPKSDKPRVIPIGSTVTDMLQSRLDRGGLSQPLADAVYRGGNRPMYGLVFSSRTGGPVSNRQFGAILSAAAQVTVVDGRRVGEVRVHDVRHSYASQLVQSGVPLDTVQKLLGHASVLVTQKYADASDAHWGSVRDILG